jgi:hypothetical protein
MLKKPMVAAFFALVSMVGLPASALAYGVADDATVTSVFVNSEGFAFVQVDKTTGAGRPQCASTTDGKMGIDVTTEVGKAFLSTIVSAYLSGKPVKIRGAGDCLDPVYTSYETLGYVVLK